MDEVQAFIGVRPELPTVRLRVGWVEQLLWEGRVALETPHTTKRNRCVAAQTGGRMDWGQKKDTCFAATLQQKERRPPSSPRRCGRYGQNDYERG